MHIDTIWHNARLLRMTPEPGCGVIKRGFVACREGRICHVGAESESRALDAPKRTDCEGRLITPGLIDCHTHLVYGGHRAAEFEQRLAGATYEEIARGGGGILSTVRATRAATMEELVTASLPRLDALLADGVTTVEVKSGYGLTWPTERSQLEAARELARRRRVEVMTTFLAAHALPPEFADNPDGYIDFVIEMMSTVAQSGLAQAVDAFCERIGFSAAQTARVFEAARALGLQVKLHADQLSDSGGAELAARFAALSADHLEYSNEAGIEALARAGTVAVLLPGAFYFLKETRPPPTALLRRYAVPIALATDCNPGTSPLTSLLLAMNLGATLFGLTVNECLEGVTRQAARALGRQNDLGTLEVGKWCDLAIWNVERPAELVYRMGLNPLYARVWRGQ